MAFFDTTWYISSVKYAAVTARPQNTTVAAGVVRRQFTTPAVGSERVFVCDTAGTTANTTDATWGLTRGAATTDGTARWRECTGAAAVNGDAINTPTWAQIKAIGSLPSAGVIIKRNNGVSYQICAVGPAAYASSEPAFSDTAGTQTIEGSGAWISLGPVGNFSAWGAPHARLGNAYATNWGAAGHKFFLADNHAETQATTFNLNSPATAAGGPTYAICVDRTAAVPPVEANYNIGASISTTTNVSLTLGNAAAFGSQYYQGITFNSGDGSTATPLLTLGAAGSNMIFKNCAFVIRNTNAAAAINIGTTGGSNPVQILWDNCTVQFAAAGQWLRLQTTNFEWRNTPSALQGATIPTALFTTLAGGQFNFVGRGLDLSAFSGQLLATSVITDNQLVFEDCKFHASMIRYGIPSAGYSSSPVLTVRCDSGATNYKTTRDEYAGSQSTETAITRVGGATDGTTPSSVKIATNAQASLLTPYRMLRLAQWNDVIGADRTVTVCGTINSASLPTDAEIWMDVQFLGSSLSPMASFKTTCKSHPLAVAANVSSDGSTWNGGGSGVGWSPFKLVVVLTSPQPQQRGYVYVSIRVAKASTIWYIDPQIVLS